MAANNVGTLRLFGVDIVASIDEPPGYHSSSSLEMAVSVDKSFSGDDDQKWLSVVSRNSDVPMVVYDAVPLRCLPPAENITSSTVTSDQKKRKHRGDGKKIRSVKRKRCNGRDCCPIPSLVDIPELLRKIESRNGTLPIFLYRKQLEETDVSTHQNRLLVNRRERFMELLSDDEVIAVKNTKKGLKVMAVDPQGTSSYKLCLKVWPSANKKMVLKTGWSKLLKENQVEQGDWVQIWGFREMEKLRLAINFNKSCEASGSSSNGGV